MENSIWDNLLDFVGLGGPDFDDLQEEINSLTIQLNLANREGRVADARLIALRISDIQATQTGMINPLVGQLETIESVDQAIEGIKKPFVAVDEFIGDVAGKVLFIGIGVILIYAYVNRK